MAEQNDKPAAEEANETPPADTSFRPEGAPAGEDGAFDSEADEPAATADTGTGSSAGTSSAGTSSTAQTLKDGAAKLTQGVTDRAKTYAEDGKSRAGSALDELAQMMHDAAGTVDEKVGAQYGQYARTAADAVTGFSESLKAKNVDDLIADATGFLKKSPAIAIGTAAALGFVLIRLVQSGLNADNDQA